MVRFLFIFDKVFVDRSLMAKMIPFITPKKCIPVISAKIPKFPPKLANLSHIGYSTSTKSIFGVMRVTWTMIVFSSKSILKLKWASPKMSFF